MSAPVFPAVGNLFMLADAVSRSISPENLTGEKGGGARTKLEQGSAFSEAQELGLGWKVNPFVVVKPGARIVMGEAAGPGVINHIWMTLGGEAPYRAAILRLYWDDEATPSVEAPVGDFFASAFGKAVVPMIDSATVVVTPGSGLNCFWPMPFRRKFRMEFENRGEIDIELYYQIDYTLQAVPDDAAYFHAQFRQIARLKEGEVYTVIDGVKGRGHYVGLYLVHAAFSPGWWGEGEVKFYLDGDTDFPTINGTGEEDYFLGSYCYRRFDGDGKPYEGEFATAYAGFYVFNKTDLVTEQYLKGRERRVAQYRWHILDPIRFASDLRITLQGLGWKTPPLRYRQLTDGYASTVFWYQAGPHAPFPALPAHEDLVFKPLKHAHAAKPEDG